MNTECEKFLTPTLQAHRGFINSEPFTSDSYKRTFEPMNQNVSSDKTIGNISSKADQFIISNENSLEPKQNETQRRPP